MLWKFALVEVMAASPPKCPAASGWHEAGSFEALDADREPWHGSKRAPSSPHSTKFLPLRLGSMAGGAVQCASSGELRCFQFSLDRFGGVRRDNNIHHLPTTAYARAWDPLDYYIMVRLSPAQQVAASGSTYKQALPVDDWLKLGAHTWPHSRHPTDGWEGSQLELWVRPAALWDSWLCLPNPIMEGMASAASPELDDAAWTAVGEGGRGGGGGGRRGGGGTYDGCRRAVRGGR